MPAIDGGRCVPNFSVTRRGDLRDGQLGPRQFVIAVAIVIVVGEREPDIARIRLQSQCRVRFDLRLRETAAGSIVTEPVKLPVKARGETMRQRKMLIARDRVLEQPKRALAVLARIA